MLQGSGRGHKTTVQGPWWSRLASGKYSALKEPKPPLSPSVATAGWLQWYCTLDGEKPSKC